jgi:hypothetical protein
MRYFFVRNWHNNNLFLRLSTTVLLMSSFLFFNTSGVHQPSTVDPDIKFLRTWDDLNQSLADGNDLQRVVCFCGEDKLRVVEAIKNKPHVVFIYVCGEHGAGAENSLSGPKVSDNCRLTSIFDWEFTGRLHLLRASKRSGKIAQALNEIRIISKIVEQSTPTDLPSHEVVEHRKISSDGPTLHAEINEADD